MTVADAGSSEPSSRATACASNGARHTATSPDVANVHAMEVAHAATYAVCRLLMCGGRACHPLDLLQYYRGIMNLTMDIFDDGYFERLRIIDFSYYSGDFF